MPDTHPRYERASSTAAGAPFCRALHARLVRVHLRSIGDWKQLSITGKAGLRVNREPRETLLLRRDETRALTIRDDAGIVTVDGRPYSGELVWRDGKLVNHVALENYVLRVLRGELPLRSVPVEAAAAQAIARA